MRGGGTRLHEVVKHTQALGVFAALHVQQRPDFGGVEAHVLVAQHNLQLLPPDAVRLGPVGVVFLQHLRGERRGPARGRASGR